MTVKIEWHPQGFRNLLRSPGVLADLDDRAQRIADAAGPGMEPSSMIGRTRARSSVITATNRARRAEATNRTLTNAIWAGR